MADRALLISFDSRSAAQPATHQDSEKGLRIEVKRRGCKVSVQIFAHEANDTPVNISRQFCEYEKLIRRH